MFYQFSHSTLFTYMSTSYFTVAHPSFPSPALKRSLISQSRVIVWCSRQCLFSLRRLIDGNNITTDDQHMWLIPFSYGEPHILNVAFSRAQTIAGLRIWNYNKSPEDSYRGVRRFSLRLKQCFS